MSNPSWTVPDSAVMLRPVRVDVKKDEFVYYETFRYKQGAVGIRGELRQLVTGVGEDDGKHHLVDFLGEDGDTIVGDCRLSHDAFRRLVRKLKAKVVPQPRTVAEAREWIEKGVAF